MEIPREDFDTSKILFTGLDSAGKTSIILSLQREFSQIAVLKPTRQAQRKIFEYLGKDIASWDLGGQERYRIAYLKSPNKYFDKTSVCIYVVDIQNEDRIKESLSYLEDVAEMYEKLEINPPIIIMLHKFDPVLKKNAPIETAKKILKIKSQIDEIIGDKHTVDYYKTSIYDLWTIMTTFSKIMLTLYPQSQLVDKTINEFADKMEADATIVLDANSLIVGQYFRTENARVVLEQCTPYFLTLNDSFQNSEREINEPFENSNSNHNGMIIERSAKAFYFDEIKFDDIDQKPLYLLIMKKENEFNNEDIEQFMKIFKSLIKLS